MNAAQLTDTLALGALTGMRSMAGPATLAYQHGGVLSRVLSTLAAGEMVADKTAAVGNRTDPMPLAGRAVMGAVVGGELARENHGNVIAGALLGASAAVAMAHIAFRVRRRLSGSSAVGGMIEDAVVMGLGAMIARRTRRRPG